MSAGGAIAAADTGSHGSNTHSQPGAPGPSGSTASSPTSTASSPTSSVNGPLRSALQGVNTTLSSLATSGLQTPTGVTNPQTGSGTAGSTTSPTKGGGLAPVAPPKLVIHVPKPPTAPTNGSAQGSGTSQPPLLPPITDLVTPITDAVEQVPVVGPIVTTVVEPLLIGPAIEVITQVENTVNAFTTVETLQLTQLSDQFWSLFGVTPLPATTVIGPQGTDNHVLVAAPNPLSPASPLTASQLLLPQRSAGPDMAAANPAGPTPLSEFAATHVLTNSSPPETAAVEPHRSSLIEVPLHIVQALGKILRSASLEELALAALPGIGGLLFFTGAGVRVGHRQAKVGFALQTTDLARFVRPGPLGVVRSGSLVVMRRPKAGAERFRQRAA